MRIYTIGFAQKSAEQFFTLLSANNVRKLLDIRLNNQSQMAGFTKARDLPYFLKKIGNIEYEYLPEFAPTKELLDNYRNKSITWRQYESIYQELLLERRVLERYNPRHFSNACLLCSEPTAEHCHRRLVAEMIASQNSKVEIIHL